MDAPTSKKTKVEGEGNSKEADDVRSMSIMEEDQGDGKPAADNDMPDQDKAPTIIEPSKPTKLNEWRMAYADSFLARCNKVDPNDFDLPFGTYVCPWMSNRPEIPWGGDIRRN